MSSAPNIPSICDACGKHFFRYKHQLKNNTCCCSRSCAASLKKKEPSLSCFLCGKMLYRKPYHVNKLVRPESITCSRSCLANARKILCKGNLNHQYGLKGELNSSFKSDIYTSNYGYVLLRCFTHPFKTKNDYVFAHRLIIEEHLRISGNMNKLINIDGQFILPKNIEVHHIDESRANNSISNLIALTRSEHLKIHNKIKKENMKENRDELGRFKPGKTTVKMYKKHSFDAGQDVISNESLTIPPRGSAIIGTGMRISVPEGCVGLLWSRSGLSVKYKVEVGAGCIDAGYTGEIKVHLYNHGDDGFIVLKGDRIAQLITMPINLSEYEVVDALDATDRGDGGFGSTGTS